MRYLTTFLSLAMWSAVTLAQEAPIDSLKDLPELETPRQIIVDRIEDAPSEMLSIELRGPSESDIEVEIGIEPEIEAEIETENEDEAPSAEPVALAPFYLSAEDYVALRGTEKHEQIVLKYEVETSALDENAEARSENIRLILGPDYASLETPKSQKIYDFKMNRFLEIRRALPTAETPEPSLIFDNISLYSKAYRNISTVRQATQNGQRRRIQISEDQEIDSFWLESSMSWAAAKLESSLKIKSTKSSVLAVWDGLSVVSASFEDEAYENAEVKNTLFAFAHHAWPIHPNILVEFYRFDSPPQNLEMVSFGPAQPKGYKQKWTLQNRESVSANFPLPVEALSAVERRPISPLVFVLSEAVENRAMGGMVPVDALAEAFAQAKADGDKLEQWIIGQRYSAYSGSCDAGEKDPICEDLAELIESGKFSAIGALDPKSKTLSDFIGATEMAKTKKSRGTALFTFQPYLDDPTTPAFILRSAAMARASLKKAAAEKSGFGTIQAEALLKQALAKDPYDPHTYVGLAQVLAAKGAFEQSWDIYDVLRAGIPTVKAVPLKIDQAEAKLQTTGPGYFLVK